MNELLALSPIDGRYIEKTNGALNLAPFVMFFILNDVKRLLFEFAAFAIMPSMAVK